MRVRMTVAAIALLAVASVANAQSGYIWAGGGMSMPTGDAGDGMESGMMTTFGAGWMIKAVKGLSLQGEMHMGSWDAKVGTGSTSQTSFFANLGYDINPNDKKLFPWVSAGIGSMSAKPKGGSSSSEMAYQLNGGLTYMANQKWAIWAGTGYISSGSGSSKMTHVPLLAGISLLLGSSQ